jgi:hypothetical protein
MTPVESSPSGAGFFYGDLLAAMTENLDKQ